jgi:hypothetical protein
VVRRFAADSLDTAAAPASLTVGMLDESGQEKKGQVTSGVKQQRPYDAAPPRHDRPQRPAIHPPKTRGWRHDPRVLPRRLTAAQSTQLNIQTVGDQSSGQ